MLKTNHDISSIYFLIKSEDITSITTKINISLANIYNKKILKIYSTESSKLSLLSFELIDLYIQENLFLSFCLHVDNASLIIPLSL